MADPFGENDGPEALEWLGQDPPPVSFGMHDTWVSAGEVVPYVRRLYGLGALRVVVPRWSIRTDEEAGGGLRACALAVALPEGGPQREALVWFCAAELGNTGTGWGNVYQHPESFVGCKAVCLSWV